MRNPVEMKNLPRARFYRTQFLLLKNPLLNHRLAVRPAKKYSFKVENAQNI